MSKADIIFSNARAFTAHDSKPKADTVAVKGSKINFVGYSNGVRGSDVYMNDSLKSAPEVVPPADATIKFALTCSPEYTDLASRVWTRLKQ